jgi:outer membrane protein assembly factor BamB
MPYSRGFLMALGLSAVLSAGSACAGEPCPKRCRAFEHLWSERFGDGREQVGLSVAADSEQNVLLAGYAAGAVDFGGGPVQPSGPTSAFLAKLDPWGNLIWARRFAASVGGSFATGVAADRDDNILLTGAFSSSIDFGGGPLTNFGGQETAFVVKLTPDGDHVWSRGATGNQEQIPRDIGVDGDGNVAISGSFRGMLDFTGGVAAIVSAGAEDVFVSRFDAAGTPLWSKAFGGTEIDRGQGLAVDSRDDLILTGFSTSSSLDFGGGPLPFAGSADVFVAKLDPAGGHVWSRSFGDSTSQDGADVAVDSCGDVVVIGAMNGTVDFGGRPLTSAGDNDVFVVKLDEHGRHVWSRRFGDAARQDGITVAVDEQGKIAVGGFFRGSIRFVGETLVSAGAEDIFVAELDPRGHPLRSAAFGDADPQSPARIAFDGQGDVLLTGFFDGALDFGGGPLVSRGGRDVLLAKLVMNTISEQLKELEKGG